MIADSAHVLSSLLELIINFSCIFYAFPAKFNMEIDLLIPDRIFTSLMLLVHVIWEKFTRSLLSNGWSFRIYFYHAEDMNKKPLI